MRDRLLESEHMAFREVARDFVAKEITPRYDQWERAGIVDRDVWLAAGAAGLLGLDVPREYGGAGLTDFRFNVLLAEAMVRYRGVAFAVQNDIVAPYLNRLSTREQRGRWLPDFCAGRAIAAIAMTEPECGSDLGAMRTTAVRDGDNYRLNGTKTLITNGLNADLVIVAAVTDEARRARGNGISLLVVERGMPGFERGPALEKIGLHAQDTAPLFFHDVVVPAHNLLGEEGRGLAQLTENLARERLSIAAAAVAGAEAVVADTLSYCQRRRAFGQTIGSFQHIRFELAEMSTEIDVARIYVDQCILDYASAELSAIDAAKAKWWTTDLQKRIVDRCLQIHGGFGYLRECDTARAFVDTRMMPIYGGTNEIMKEIIGRSLGM